MAGRKQAGLWGFVFLSSVLLLLGSSSSPPMGEALAEPTGAPPVRPEEDTRAEEPLQAGASEGMAPLYLVKEVVEVTSDHATVDWVTGPRVIGTRHTVLEGAESPDLRVEVSGLDVRVTKPIGDTTKVVVEVEALALQGEPVASVFLGKGAVASVGAEVLAYEPGRGVFVGVADLVADGPDPETFEKDLAALYDLPAARATVEKGMRELEKKVFAFYYNWYASLEGPSREVLGWDVPAPQTPLMGGYDSADEDVIYAHMEMAKAAGIDGFIANWVGPGDSIDAVSMPVLLRVAEEVGLKVSAYADMPLNLPLSHVTHPAWLKDAGRPVIFEYTVEKFGDPAQWWEWRREAEAQYGPLVLIGDTTNPDYLHVLDGFHAYIYIERNYRTFYEGAMERLELGLASQVEVEEAFASALSGGDVRVEKKPFSVTVIPGYDDTPNPERYPGLRLDREGGGFYSEYWETAIDLDPHSVLITSWNEWLEGTEIEPSVQHGFAYLKLTRRFVEEYKRISLATPEADYAATLLSFEVRPDRTGEGRLLLAADDELPMVMVRVEVQGRAGIRSVNLQGDFRTYLRGQSGANASVLIPAVHSGMELEISVPFAIDSFAVNISEAHLDVAVTAYDPSGTLHQLIDTRGTVETPGLGLVPILIGIGAAAGAGLGILVIWRRRAKKPLPRAESRQ